MRKVSLVAMFIAMSVAIISCEENNSDIEKAEATNEVSESSEETSETKKQEEVKKEEDSADKEISNEEKPEGESEKEENNGGEETNEKSIEEELNDALDSITFDDLVALRPENPDALPSKGIQFSSVKDLSKAFGSYTIIKKTTTTSTTTITDFDPDELLNAAKSAQGSSFKIANNITISAGSIEFLNNSTSLGTASLDQTKNEIVFNASTNGSAVAELVFRISSDKKIIDVINATEKVSYRFERK